MNKQINPEDILRTAELRPGESVKKVVMAECESRYGNRHSSRLWEKKVPLYQALIAAILLAAMINVFEDRFLDPEIETSQGYRIVESVVTVNERF